MKRPWLLLVILTLAALTSARPSDAAVKATGGLSLGVNAGLGGQADLTLDDIAQGLPVSARIGVGYWVLDPGDPVMARRVFINENTGGSPEKGGNRWDFRADAVRRLGGGPLKGWWLLVGPRFSAFHGDFDFVNGNETFFITTRQWGFGGALEGRWATTPGTELVASAGLDWFANSTIQGHGTAYSPNGATIDPKENFAYADADQAINQPHLAPRLLLGLQRRFGR